VAGGSVPRIHAPNACAPQAQAQAKAQAQARAASARAAEAPALRRAGFFSLLSGASRTTGPWGFGNASRSAGIFLETNAVFSVGSRFEPRLPAVRSAAASIPIARASAHMYSTSQKNSQ
jgi:hypothetical protein